MSGYRRAVPHPTIIMALPTRALGGTASSIHVGCIGLGLMRLTWNGETASVPDKQAFEMMLAAVEQGVTYWNSATFYGTSDPLANLKLLGRFFAAYPDLADKVTIGVKGGFHGIGDLSRPDCSEANLRAELAEAQKALGPQKRIDIYGPARRDMNTALETTMQTLHKLQKEGLFSHIGLSEVSADTIRRSHAVAPIATVEVEYSPFTLDIEQNGVLQACKELGLTVVAYSPLGWGLLTGAKASDLRASRGMLERFDGTNFDKNKALAAKLEAFGAQCGYDAIALTLAWELMQYEKVIPIPGTTKTTNMLNNVRGAYVTLSEEEKATLQKLVHDIGANVAGGRYNALLRSSLCR